MPLGDVVEYFNLPLAEGFDQRLAGGEWRDVHRPSGSSIVSEGRQQPGHVARAMLLGSQAEAERVKAELAAGGNFSTLAESYSQHESKTKGGKLDGLERGDMGSSAFDRVAFNLTVNEVSEPVRDELIRTTGGYWLIKVVDRGNHELGEEVRQKLTNQRFNDWLEEQSEKSTIETYLDAYKKEWAMNKVLAEM